MTLRLSNDLGSSWEDFTIIHEGPSAYSDLTKLPNGNLGCLYEAGEESPYEGVAFSEVDINQFN